jgi:hypothetical protein
MERLSMQDMGTRDRPPHTSQADADAAADHDR